MRMTANAIKVFLHCTNLSFLKMKIAENMTRGFLTQVLRIMSWVYESVTEFAPCSYRIFIPWASRGPSADVFLLDMVIVNCP